MRSQSYSILAISLLPGVGPATYWKLIDCFGGIEAIAEASPGELRAVVKSELAEAIHKLFSCSTTSVNDIVKPCLDWCEANGVALVCHLEPVYPRLLKEIQRAPPVLYVKGNLACLQAQQIAIVGSRSASPGGKAKAFELAKDLALNGMAVTSGLALGVDTQAHRGALAGGGVSIAVLGSGLARIYPKSNLALAQELIQSGGCIVSEFPPTTPPSAPNFPQRNRIISGLSLGTVVVEAAEKSGSLITARFALEQNREVFAVPGSTHNPLARGCHSLIKQGALLVESAADIVEELSGFAGLSMQATSLVAEPVAQSVALEESEISVFAAVDYVAGSLEQIAERVQMPTGDLLAVLLSLELKGLIVQSASGYVRVN